MMLWEFMFKELAIIFYKRPIKDPNLQQQDTIFQI